MSKYTVNINSYSPACYSWHWGFQENVDRLQPMITVLLLSSLKTVVNVCNNSNLKVFFNAVVLAIKLKIWLWE